MDVKKYGVDNDHLRASSIQRSNSCSTAAANTTRSTCACSVEGVAATAAVHHRFHGGHCITTKSNGGVCARAGVARGHPEAERSTGTARNTKRRGTSGCGAVEFGHVSRLELSRDMISSMIGRSKVRIVVYQVQVYGRRESVPFVPG